MCFPSPVKVDTGDILYVYYICIYIYMCVYMYVSTRVCVCVCVFLTAIVDVDRSTVYRFFGGHGRTQRFDLPMKSCQKGGNLKQLS